MEDNPSDLELTMHALRTHNIGSGIQVARDGEEALQFLFREGPFSSRPEGNPRMVLLDLKLPKVDGVEVLRKLRQDERTSKVPVVVLTSSREVADIEATYGLGVNSYVVKPVEFEKFAAAVSELGQYWLTLNQPPLQQNSE